MAAAPRNARTYVVKALVARAVVRHVFDVQSDAEVDGNLQDQIGRGVEVDLDRHGQLGGDLELSAVTLAWQVGDRSQQRDADTASLIAMEISWMTPGWSSPVSRRRTA